MTRIQNHGYAEMTAGSTGSDQEVHELISVPFDRYEIIVRVSSGGKFRGIEGLHVRQDFLTSEQRVRASGYFDVEEFYRDE